MALSKLGDLITPISDKCNISNLSVYDVSGINKDKEFFSPTIQVGEDTSNYKIVPPNHFACNLMHVGRDIVIPIALNKSNENVIVSPAYAVFYVTNNKIILNEYLYMVFKKIDFDRYAAFCTDSSVRDGLEWNRFLEIEIDIPPIEVQQKVVDVYLAMVANQKAYEKGLDDLKLTYEAYIENLRKTINPQKIAPYIEKRIEKNAYRISIVKGISKDGFINPNQASSEDTSNYKVVQKGDFVFSPPRINIGSIGLWNEDYNCVCSPIYEVFCCSSEKLINKYLFLWLKRDEFYRYTGFHSIASVRNNFDFDMLSELKIPVPELEVQKAIVEVYESYKLRKEINENLKKQINEICPVLIKGSISM